ncbi:DmsC/YnfH family molybdoenzyme membrane anchor subunit, partial [Shigella sonnei]
MGNGWHEWPLVIFTVLGQCVVGALIVSGIGWFAAKNDADRQRIVRGMFFLWLLGNDSNLLIVFYVQIMPDDFVMQLHR